MSRTIQWTNPLASGSSTKSVSAAVPSGAPDHASSGETSSPSQVNRFGIAPPGSKAVDVRTKSGMVASGVGDGAVADAVGAADDAPDECR